MSKFEEPRQGESWRAYTRREARRLRTSRRRVVRALRKEAGR